MWPASAVYCSSKGHCVWNVVWYDFVKRARISNSFTLNVGMSCAGQVFTVQNVLIPLSSIFLSWKCWNCISKVLIMGLLKMVFHREVLSCWNLTKMLLSILCKRTNPRLRCLQHVALRWKELIGRAVWSEMLYQHDSAFFEGSPSIHHSDKIIRPLLQPQAWRPLCYAHISVG